MFHLKKSASWIPLTAVIPATVLGLAVLAFGAGPLDGRIPPPSQLVGSGSVMCENGRMLAKSVFDPDPASDRYVTVIQSMDGFTMVVVEFPNGPAYVAVDEKVTTYPTVEDLMRIYPTPCSIPLVGGGEKT